MRDNGNLDKSFEFKIECPFQSYIGDKQLGVGGFNTVYSINGINDKVLRVSNKYYLANQDVVSLFSNQLAGLFIQAYLSKECPNICKVYDFGFCYLTSGGVQYVKIYAILERLSSDLMSFFEHDYGEGPKPFNTKQWLTMLKDVLTAIECIHQHGYAHLDIKPENMAFNLSGKLCLFDFDNALFFPTDKTIYVSSNLKGTEEYLAPELYPPDVRIKAYRKYTKFADIYPLSVILHSCSHYVSDFDKYKDIYYTLTDKMGDNLLVQSDKTPLVYIHEPNVGYYAVPLTGRISAAEGIKLIEDYESSHLKGDMEEPIKRGGIKRHKKMSRRKNVSRIKKKKTKRRNI